MSIELKKVSNLDPGGAIVPTSIFYGIDENGNPVKYTGAQLLTFNSSPASEATPGIIQIATQAEADAGTNDTKAITPLKLKVGFNDLFIDNEKPTVTNGSPIVTLANSPVDNSEHVYLNGVRQNSGGNDYSISTNTITFTFNLVTGDVVIVDYRI